MIVKTYMILKTCRVSGKLGWHSYVECQGWSSISSNCEIGRVVTIQPANILEIQEFARKTREGTYIN